MMDGGKKAVLERLARTSPLQLCSEAKVERCRAMQNLHRCGQEVHDILSPCGHAGLCPACIENSDLCPICYAPVERDEYNSIKRCPRLYDECEAVGMGTITFNEELVHPDGAHCTPDVRRLFTFFDIALEYGLVCLICHYIIEVCLDNTAVSSDAVKAVLLDGTVVKEWATGVFLKIKRILRDVYCLPPGEMRTQLERFNKVASQLRGVLQVVETLEAPITDPYSSVLMELRSLLEAIRRVSQHLDVMAWCARHSFLEDFPGRFPGVGEWRAAFKVRKHYADERTWPNSLRPSLQREQSVEHVSLFIEEAVENLGLGGDDEESGGNNTFELMSLKHANMPSSPSFRPRWDTEPSVKSGMEYPPESVRNAVDTLFLDGSSDLVMAKKAILLYYLFDRYWGLHSSHWELLVDDYALAMELPQHVKTESHVFFLLDEDSEIALKEAAVLLPEVVGPTMHPRLPRVLLQRNQADLALSVLRSCGRYGHLQDIADSFLDGEADDGLVALEEAVTAVRVLMECGLLLEAFVYQRAHCKELSARTSAPDDGRGPGTGAVVADGGGGGDLMGVGERRATEVEREALVGEVCWLCIRRSWVDRMIALPWSSEEESVIKECLMEAVKLNPCSSSGSFLFIFYIQRNRYLEARSLHQQLEEWESSFAYDCIDDSKLKYLQQAAEQRCCLLDAGLTILPNSQSTEEPSKVHPTFLFSRAGQPPEAARPMESDEALPAPIPAPLLPNHVFASPILFPHLYANNPTAAVQMAAATSTYGDRPVLTRRDPTMSNDALAALPSASKRSTASKIPPAPAFDHSPILGRRLSYAEAGGSLPSYTSLLPVPPPPFPREIPIGPDSMPDEALAGTLCGMPSPFGHPGKAKAGKANGHPVFPPKEARPVVVDFGADDARGLGATPPSRGLRGGELRPSPSANGVRRGDGGLTPRGRLDSVLRRQQQQGRGGDGSAVKRLGGAVVGGVFGQGDDSLVTNGDVMGGSGGGVIDGYKWKSGRDQALPPPRQTSDSLVETDNPFSVRQTSGRESEEGAAAEAVEVPDDFGMKDGVPEGGLAGPETGSWPTAQMRNQAANGTSPWASNNLNSEGGVWQQLRTEALGPRWREEEEDDLVSMGSPPLERKQRSGEKRSRLSGNSRFHQSLGLG